MTPSDALCIIFDSDGTLVDTERLSITVLCEHLASNGIPIDLSQAVANWPGQDLHEVLAIAQHESGVQLPSSFMDEFRVLQLARLEAEVQPIPGARELLGSISKPRCVASNAPTIKVEMCLRVTELLPYFDDDSIFSAYDVSAWKPKPDVFIHAATKMGFSPNQCVVIEDSMAGIQAGLAAGAHVIAYDPAGALRRWESVTYVGDLHELMGRL